MRCVSLGFLTKAFLICYKFTRSIMSDLACAVHCPNMPNATFERRGGGSLADGLLLVVKVPTVPSPTKNLQLSRTSWGCLNSLIPRDHFRKQRLSRLKQNWLPTFWKKLKTHNRLETNVFFNQTRQDDVLILGIFSSTGKQAYKHRTSCPIARPLPHAWFSPLKS